MTESELAKIIVDIAFKLHVALGPGLLESMYLAEFAYELRKRGLKVEVEKPVPVVYESVCLEIGFRADSVVEDKVIIELKSVEAITDVHKKQLLTYLKMTGLKLGLLINFGRDVLKGNVVRIANGLEQSTFAP